MDYYVGCAAFLSWKLQLSLEKHWLLSLWMYSLCVPAVKHQQKSKCQLRGLKNRSKKNHNFQKMISKIEFSYKDVIFPLRRRIAIKQARIETFSLECNKLQVRICLIFCINSTYLRFESWWATKYFQPVGDSLNLNSFHASHFSVCLNRHNKIPC